MHAEQDYHKVHPKCMHECSFWSLCRSWTSRLVSTTQWWTLRQGSWRPRKSFHDGGEGESEMKEEEGREEGKEEKGREKGGRERWVGQVPLFLRKDINHLYQLLSYARKIFHQIETIDPVNVEAGKL